MRAPGWLWEVRAPSSSPSLACLPLSLPPLSPPSPPPPLSALPGRGLLAGAGRNWTRDGKPPAGGGAAPRAAALRPDGARLGGVAGGGRKRRTPAPDAAVGRRARAEEGGGKKVRSYRLHGPWGSPGVSRSSERGFGEAGPARARTWKCDVLLLFACSSRGIRTPIPTPPFQYRPRPISSLPSRQLKMTGRENSSDIRGQPAPGRRFQGAASNPPPTPGPRKPLQRLRTRRPCSDSSTALFRLS